MGKFILTILSKITFKVRLSLPILSKSEGTCTKISQSLYFFIAQATVNNFVMH